MLSSNKMVCRRVARLAAALGYASVLGCGTHSTPEPLSVIDGAATDGGGAHRHGDGDARARSDAARDVVRSDASDASVTCAEYCNVVQAACTDTAPTHQYWGADECLTLCNSLSWPASTRVETSGNTLGCRLHHADLAAATTNLVARKLNCDIAGASGGGVCGSYCEAYCTYALAVCTGAQTLYASRHACMNACAALPATPNGTPGYAEPNYIYYNTVQCRIGHLVYASGMPTTHCAHAAEAPDPITCSDTSPPNCAHYCAMTSTYCNAPADRLFGTSAECFRYCSSATFPAGTHADTTGNTLGCRINQAEYATTHQECVNAGPTGGSACR